jgi:hypothetical protein
LLLLFHADQEEGDEVFEAMAELARDLRNHHVYKVVVGKINMLHNEVIEFFTVQSYPSLYLIYRTEDAELGFQKIKASHKKELMHLVFQSSQRLTKEYDDKIYYSIMSGQSPVIHDAESSNDPISDEIL